MKADFKLPKWDEEARRPKSKMPDCPNCLEDELGMINKNRVICYCCNWSVMVDPSTGLAQVSGVSDFVLKETA